ncbi:MAG TPA: NAD(P)/FAD-dependent oxidoreductase [Gemmataceae bacterium]|jgi:NADH dehydrogenase|nr:NAD(P)/FAD-dependent oxidoreductase [Gemmataceae bacterium]
MPERHQVVIVGGGFGGLNAALALRSADADVTLIDRRNFHLFQPLLYQVATGGLSPANIAAPLRAVLKRHSNTRVLLGEVTGFDLTGKAVLMGEDRVPFDTLVLAAGATNNYFNRPDWEQFAPGLKTIEEATDIRRRVLSAFEAAERFDGAGHRERYMTFVVVGGGATGVEMAGAISELARHTLRNNFRTLDPGTARIVLVEGHNRLLPPFPEKLSAYTETTLQKMGVEVWTSAKVRDIQADHVLVEKDGKVTRIDTATVIWGAGVKASPLGKLIAEATGAPADRAGRIVVGPDLTVPGHPNIFVIGDMAAATSGGQLVPGVAPAAMQEGRFVAAAVKKRLAGRTDVGHFVYWDKGSMATIGRNSAVAVAGWLKFTGFIAWLAWLFVHIMYLISHTNRIMVLFQWGYSYFSRNRAARLITGEDLTLRRP